jgi:hypothetical protein
MKREAKDKQRRKALMLQAVQEQMTNPQTPEVKMQYNRLVLLGYSDSEAREQIATILAFYLWHTLQQDDYSYTDYVADLARLPEIDWEEDDAVEGQ